MLYYIVFQIYSELSDEIPDSDKQWVAMACYLMRHGADLYIANKRGERPINLITSPALHSALMSYKPQQPTAASS